MTEADLLDNIKVTSERLASLRRLYDEIRSEYDADTEKLKSTSSGKLLWNKWQDCLRWARMQAAKKK